MPEAQLESIWIAPCAGDPMLSLQSAEVEENRGISGDRYHAGEGSFSRWQRANRAISLIESESILSIRNETGMNFGEGRTRRNLVTSGISLTDLLGGKFRIGTALFRASAVCAPCRYLERLLGEGTFKALRNRGGIRAEVIRSGLIQCGDTIVPVGVRSRLP